MGRVGESAAKILVDSDAGATLVHKKLVPPQTIIRRTPRRVTGVTGAELDIRGEAEVEFEIHGLRKTRSCLIAGEMENDALL